MSADVGRRLLELPNALRRFGCTPIPLAGWEDRGADFTRWLAALDHHTAGARTGYAPSLGVVTRGRGTPGTSDYLPGPLSNVLTPRAPDGDNSVYVVAAGKCNHSGRGLWATADSNYEIFGNERELVGDGSDITPWRNEMACRVAAAFLWLAGLDADALARHAEYALPKGRKIDTAGVTGAWLRRRTTEILAIGSAGGTSIPPPTGLLLEDDMPTIACVDVAVDPTEPRRGYKLVADGSIHPFAHTGVSAPPAMGSPELDLMYADWKKRNIAPAIRLVMLEWGTRPKGHVYCSDGVAIPVGGAAQTGPLNGWWPNSFLRPQPVA